MRKICIYHGNCADGFGLAHDMAPVLAVNGGNLRCGIPAKKRREAFFADDLDMLVHGVHKLFS